MKLRLWDKKSIVFAVEETNEGHRARCNQNPSVYFLGRTREEALGEAVKGNRALLEKSGISIAFEWLPRWLSVTWPDRLRFRIDPEKECLLAIKNIAEGEGSVDDRFYRIKSALNSMYPKTYVPPEKPER